MNYRLILFCLAFINFIAPLGIAPLFDLDEGAFSEATREMIESGNYITTYLNGNLRFDKPILIYWLQAFSVKLFGLNEFALRFPSALSAMLWAYSIWYFTKKEFNEKVAFLATLFMISSLQINIIAKAAIADSLLNLFITTTLFSAWIYIKSKDKRYLYATFALMAFGTLTKGPVAIMIPFITIVLYLSIKREFKFLFKSLFNPVGIFIFLAIAAPWYILEYLDQGQKFIDGFFLKHNLQRFNQALESHRGSLFYYIPVLLIGLLPFTSYLLKTFRKFGTFLKNDLTLYLTIWFTFVFIFFSLSGTKLPHYIIYGYSSIFILIALSIYKNLQVTYWTILPILLLYIALFILPFLVDYINIKDLYIQEMLTRVEDIFNYKYLLYIFLATILTILVLYIKLKVEYKLIIISLTFTLLINFVIIKAYGDLAQKPIKDAAIYAREHNLKVIMYRFTKPSFLVYYRAKSIKTKPKIGSIIFTNTPKLKDFKNYKTIYKKGGVYLVEIVN